MLDHSQEQHRAIYRSLNDLQRSIHETFKGSREGFATVDVDEYLRTRDLLLLLFKQIDAEVYRVCFEERLSNLSCYGDRDADSH